MVETISPVVYGTRIRWAGALALHARGGGDRGRLRGRGRSRRRAARRPLGRRRHRRRGGGRPALLRELTGVRVPIPQLRRQVPDWWRTYFGRPVARSSTGRDSASASSPTWATGRSWRSPSRSPRPGGRRSGRWRWRRSGSHAAWPPWWAPGSTTRPRAAASSTGSARCPAASGVRATLSRSGRSRRAAVPAAAGGWEAAAAIVAVTFAWASIAKVTGWGRWRGAWPRIGCRSGGAVRGPGRPRRGGLGPDPRDRRTVRAAAAIALGSLAVFSVALVRIGLRDGVRVSCGCFGREHVDVRFALGRNLALAIVSAAAWWLAPADPGLAAPDAGDLVPLLLVTGAVVTGALTAWRATVWLGRGGREPPARRRPDGPAVPGRDRHRRRADGRRRRPRHGPHRSERRRGKLDVSTVRLAHQPAARSGRFTYQEWSIREMWDRGYLMVMLDTREGAPADHYVLVRSNLFSLEGTLADPLRGAGLLPRHRPRAEVHAERVDPGRAQPAAWGATRPFYRWWVQTIVTSDRCPHTCQDRAPNGGATALNWRPGMSPSPSPSPTSTPSPTP